jgi:hypothetical protein
MRDEKALFQRPKRVGNRADEAALQGQLLTLVKLALFSCSHVQLIAQVPIVLNLVWNPLPVSLELFESSIMKASTA